MKVLINGYKVDFTLDTETTVKDLANSILSWSQDRNLIFTDLFVDNEPFSTDDLPERNLDAVGEVNCIVQSRSDLIISTIGEAVAYCDRILGFITQSTDAGSADAAQKESLARGTEWLNETLRLLFTLLSLDMNDVYYLDKPVSHISKLLTGVTDGITSVTDDVSFGKFLAERKDLFEMVRSTFKMLYLSDSLKRIIMKSIDSPEQLINGLREIRESLPGQRANLEQAAVSFQSGKDSEGSDLLQTFTDFIYKYLRLCHHISPVFGVDSSAISDGSRTLDDLNSTIRCYLEDIVTVMENNDIISLSDILEYQMKPELENCGAFIDLLLEKIS